MLLLAFQEVIKLSEPLNHTKDIIKHHNQVPKETSLALRWSYEFPSEETQFTVLNYTY